MIDAFFVGAVCSEYCGPACKVASDNANGAPKTAVCEIMIVAMHLP